MIQVTRANFRELLRRKFDLFVTDEQLDELFDQYSKSGAAELELDVPKFIAAMIPQVCGLYTYITFKFIHCIALHNIALRCVALRYVALRYTAAMIPQDGYDPYWESRTSYTQEKLGYTKVTLIVTVVTAITVITVTCTSYTREKRGYTKGCLRLLE